MGRFLLPSWVQTGRAFRPRPWRTTSTFLECVADLKWIQGATFTQRWQKHKGNSGFTDYSSIWKRTTLLKEVPSTTGRCPPRPPGPPTSCHCPKTFIQASKCGWMCVCVGVCDWCVLWWTIDLSIIYPNLCILTCEIKSCTKDGWTEGQTDRWTLIS